MKKKKNFKKKSLQFYIFHIATHSIKIPRTQSMNIYSLYFIELYMP